MSLPLALMAGFLLGHASASSSSAVASSSHIYLSSTVTCYSQLGLTSVASIPTTSITRTISDTNPVVVYTTAQDTVTVTPGAITVTLTDYETDIVISTASTVTDTFSTTSTEYDTTTVVVTPAPVTATETTTVDTTIITTTTVPTPAGFTPVADTLSTTLAVTNAKKKRSLTEEEEEDTCGAVGPYDYQYATAVECVAKVTLHTTSTSTVTATPATATAATPTTTTTDTATITSTSTVVPDVSTTLSYSTTSTLTETSTADPETSTLTVTATSTTVSTTSYYAACATNNIAGLPFSSDFGALAGEYINTIDYQGITGEEFKVASGATAYDCCAACQENSICIFSMFEDNYCYSIETSDCSASNYVYVTVGAGDYGVTLSNGLCGEIVMSAD
ncbi:hypothetical protein ASPZODRAFT_136833 [Penicilliopsis zonata CBS 506.65]|uniref:Apple domain-containing protein n=1 Tax=Penicilliopsis zonata CBS 506.65 TaxID=1073090 RepID=A0A1L9S733_9EURO|nr:hypothetical protein ASPZODRAFT_136833 [Penicilliopsis zonata CBS 506.65]OJJ42963.1 hypothetical protein ASPZODRAFT_136833 [Penicilliopsis zonata CBS 506.65]